MHALRTVALLCTAIGAMLMLLTVVRDSRFDPLVALFGCLLLGAGGWLFIFSAL